MEDLMDGVLDWLLEDENPSVKYWTLLDLLDKKPSDNQVEEAKRGIMNTVCVQKILREMHPDGYWEKCEDMYNPKYRAGTHNLLILSLLGASLNDSIRKAIEHIFRFQRNSGHFYFKMPKTARGYDSQVKDSCCLDGNILFYLLHFGYLEDPRVERLISFQEDYYSNDEGGWNCRAYPLDGNKVFPLNCYMGRVKVLRGLAAIPVARRSKRIRSIIKQEVEVILKNGIYKYLRNPDNTRKEKAGWKRFGFPIFYQSDVLEVLGVLTKLGVKDERMQESIDLVLSTQQEDGKWLLKNSFNGKMLCDIEEKGKPSKWITLRALETLKHW